MCVWIGHAGEWRLLLLKICACNVLIDLLLHSFTSAKKSAQPNYIAVLGLIILNKGSAVRLDCSVFSLVLCLTLFSPYFSVGIFFPMCILVRWNEVVVVEEEEEAEFIIIIASGRSSS